MDIPQTDYERIASEQHLDLPAVKSLLWRARQSRYVTTYGSARWASLFPNSPTC